jgi:ATP-binding cassette, subfamily B, bacterial PglK
MTQKKPQPIVIDKGSLKRLWSHLPRARRKQFSLLIALMMIASVAELVSIGAILPFLGVLTSPERLFNLEIAQPAIRLFGITEPKNLLAPITISFAIAAIGAAGIRLLMLWANTRFSFAAGADLGFEIYRRTLYQPYQVHISRNSSEIINGITAKSQALIAGALTPLMNMLSGGIMLAAVLSALIFYQPMVALAIFGSLGIIYWAIYRTTRKRLSENSIRIASAGNHRIKALQEGLGGIRDLLLDNTQETYCDIYRESDQRMRKSQAGNLFISASPRLIMEAIGMCLISGLAFFLASRPNGLTDALPILGGLALGAQRLLPIMQQVYTGWTNVKGNHKSLNDALDLLDQPLHEIQAAAEVEKIPFSKSIQFEGTWFKYQPESPWTISNLDLEIPKGSRVGIVGKTGSGKSTLTDILMGLLSPTQGQMLVDGVRIDENSRRGWQKHIAHVPQNIFLADASIEENIAFGTPKSKINHARVIKAAEQAQIASTIEALDAKYQTKVGERGVRLSGGQRQRLGIARALYKNADVLIFDEATSALDSETEQSVVQAIDRLDRNLTIFIVAHRISTLDSCDLLISIEAGKATLKTNTRRTNTSKEAN